MLIERLDQKEQGETNFRNADDAKRTLSILPDIHQSFFSLHQHKNDSNATGSRSVDETDSIIQPRQSF